MAVDVAGGPEATQVPTVPEEPPQVIIRALAIDSARFYALPWCFRANGGDFLFIPVELHLLDARPHGRASRMLPVSYMSFYCRFLYAAISALWLLHALLHILIVR